MPRAIWKKASWRQHRLLFGALVGGCTLLLLGALLVSAHEARLHTLQLARIAAVTAIDKDMMYRNWNSGHAAVYVSVTAETPPNPYLADIPERDIVTPSGRPLTLMNPAYMTRQAMEIKNKEMGIQQHMTSLNPLRPENAADPWETETFVPRPVV